MKCHITHCRQRGAQFISDYLGQILPELALTLGVRVATLIQYVARRSLEESGDTLTGLHLENPKKATSTPTCERLLRAFSKINLTIVETGDSIIRQITPLSHLQTKILKLLGVDATIYSGIAELAKPLRC